MFSAEVRPMTTRKYKISAIALLASFLLGAFLPVGAWMTPIKSQFIKPAFWCVLLAVGLAYLPKVHMPGKLRRSSEVFVSAIVIASLHLTVKFSVGFIFEAVGKTPYDISASGVLYTVVGIVPIAFAREFVRSYAIGVAEQIKKRSVILMAILIVIFTLVEINFNRVRILRSSQDWTIFLCNSVLPILAKNGLLSMLCYYGNFASAVAYNVTFSLFWRLFPYLPALPWLFECCIDIFVPLAGAYLVYAQHQKHRHTTTRQSASTGSLLVASVLLIWFVVGVFPVYPSVVLTGSMEPLISAGDVVIIRKITAEEDLSRIGVGDVISFQYDGAVVCHRIVEIVTDEAGNINYRTKGDNNSSGDSRPVHPNSLRGELIGVVPKIGLFSLLLHGAEPIPEEVVN